MVNDGLVLLLALMTLLRVMFMQAVITLSPKTPPAPNRQCSTCPRRPFPRRPARGCSPPRPRCRPTRSHRQPALAP